MNQRDSIKLIGFDVEGTLIQNDLWSRLHPLFKVSDKQDCDWYSQYKSGEINFREWLQLISDSWSINSVSKEKIKEALNPLTWNNGAVDVVRKLSDKYRLAVISSGVDIFVLDAATQLGISDAYFFNTLEFSEDGMFKAIKFPVDGTEVDAKISALHELSLKYAIPPEQMAFVGDSKNDLGAFRFTGHGVLFGDGTPELQSASWRQIKDFSELLAIF